MPQEVCMITTSLPPSISGLADYCRQLWNHWPVESKVPVSRQPGQNNAQPRWHILVTQGAEASRKLWPEAEIFEFDLSRDGIRRALEEQQASTVVLQYVGYGYDNGGQPFWLPEALRDWLRERQDRRLIVMFHETWARGRPWQRAFWQSGKQRRCAAELLDIAAVAVTSNAAGVRDLKSLNIPTKLYLIPLGSSFSLSAAEYKNWRSLVVIGKEHSRLRALKTHSSFLKQISKAGLIDKLVLAGQSQDPGADSGRHLIDSWKLPVDLDCAYNFASNNVPDTVLTSGLSLMHTQSTWILKSTSFQLAAQLGQVPIAIEEHYPGEPLIPGKHYLSYRSGQTGKVISCLKSPEVLSSIAHELSLLGQTYLSWTAIANAWDRLISAGDSDLPSSSG